MKKSLVLAAAVATLGLVASSQAAVINWDTAQAINLADNTQVYSPTGSVLVGSFSNGAGGTANGIAFPYSTATTSFVESGATLGNWVLPSNSTGYAGALSGAHTGASVVLTASGLTVGQDYAVQIFAYGRAIGAGTTTIDGGGSISGSLSYSANSGSFVIGHFKADAATQTFKLSSNGMVNAASIVAVPEPASMSLLGLGAMGLLARRRRQA